VSLAWLEACGNATAELYWPGTLTSEALRQRQQQQQQQRQQTGERRRRTLLR
jgi:hypothetical protein